MALSTLSNFTFGSAVTGAALKPRDAARAVGRSSRVVVKAFAAPNAQKVPADVLSCKHMCIFVCMW